MRLSMLPTIVREKFGERQLPDRIPEPEVMDAEENVGAFATAGRVPGAVEAAQVFHAGRTVQVLAGCRRVIDLGCGPATQLARLAEMLPNTAFVGVDLSPGMLEEASDHVRERGLDNVELAEGDITRLAGFEDNTFDGVMSTMTLHHLPDIQHLEACFAEIGRILKHDGALYLVDFNRLKSRKSIRYFANMDPKLPAAFREDYENSLCAAFLERDFAAVTDASLPPSVSIYTSGLIPLLIIMKTEDRPVSPEIRSRLGKMRKELGKHAGDLDTIRRMFRMAGLQNDPFE